jgi:hypothetical protein
MGDLLDDYQPARTYDEMFVGRSQPQAHDG